MLIPALLRSQMRPRAWITWQRTLKEAQSVKKWSGSWQLASLIFVPAGRNKQRTAEDKALLLNGRQKKKKAPLLVVLLSSLPSSPFNGTYNGQRKSKTLICQDDSLSIYRSFYIALLRAAAGEMEPASYLLLQSTYWHIQGCGADWKRLWGDDFVAIYNLNE